MDALSETESEPEQFPTEPVVEDTSLEKPKKRVYKKKVKIAEPAAAEPAKPKRVMTEEHREKMRLAREASKARKALKPEPITQETEVLPEAKKRGRPKKVKEDKVVEPKAEPKEKVIVKEVHHHYAEPKKEKAKKEAAPRKPRQPKVESKPTTVVVDFV